MANELSFYWSKRKSSITIFALSCAPVLALFPQNLHLLKRFLPWKYDVPHLRKLSSKRFCELASCNYLENKSSYRIRIRKFLQDPNLKSRIRNSGYLRTFSNLKLSLINLSNIDLINRLGWKKFSHFLPNC